MSIDKMLKKHKKAGFFLEILTSWQTSCIMTTNTIMLDFKNE